MAPTRTAILGLVAGPASVLTSLSAPKLATAALIRSVINPSSVARVVRSAAFVERSLIYVRNRVNTNVAAATNAPNNNALPWARLFNVSAMFSPVGASASVRNRPTIA